MKTDFYNHIDQLIPLRDLYTPSGDLIYELRLFFAIFYNTPFINCFFSIIKNDEIQRKIMNENETQFVIFQPSLQYLSQKKVIEEILNNKTNDFILEFEILEVGNKAEITSVKNLSPNLLKNFTFFTEILVNGIVKHNKINLIEKWDDIIVKDIYDSHNNDVRISIPNNTHFYSSVLFDIYQPE